MTAYYDTEGLELFLSSVIASADEIWMVNTYSLGDDWATVSSNKIASLAISPADFTGPTVSGEDREVTFNGKNGAPITADSTGTNQHAVLVDTVNSRIKVVTEETGDQALYNGNTLNFPPFTFSQRQPSTV